MILNTVNGVIEIKRWNDIVIDPLPIQWFIIRLFLEIKFQNFKINEIYLRYEFSNMALEGLKICDDQV